MNATLNASPVQINSKGYFRALRKALRHVGRSIVTSGAFHAVTSDGRVLAPERITKRTTLKLVTGPAPTALTQAPKSPRSRKRPTPTTLVWSRDKVTGDYSAGDFVIRKIGKGFTLFHNGSSEGLHRGTLAVCKEAATLLVTVGA